MKEIRKLKRVVIKEELVALTGKVEHAIVLNQFIYWSERVRDVDKYLKEEMERIRKFSDGSTESEADIKENLSNGWIYKTATEMKDECMFEKSATTMERIMNSLVEKGWLDRRRNPKHKWDKTYQYRVNIVKIQHDLMEFGYSLEGYSLGEIKDSNSDEDTKLQNEGSKVQIEASRLHFEESRLQNEGAIPEITPEITSFEEEEEITVGHVMTFLNEQINKREITNQKTITAIFEVAAKCKAIGTSDRQAMENFCITIIEDKMKLFGQKSSKSRTDKKSTRTEPVPDWLDGQNNGTEGNEGNKLTPEEFEAEKRRMEERLKKYKK